MSIKHLTDITTTPRVDGDFNAIVVQITDTGARDGVIDSDRYVHTINHGLNRVPIACQIIMKSKPVDVYVLSKDKNKIVIKFTEQRADVNLRIW